MPPPPPGAQRGPPEQSQVGAALGCGPHEQAEATLGTSPRQGPLQAATPDRKPSKRLVRSPAAGGAASRVQPSPRGGLSGSRSSAGSPWRPGWATPPLGPPLLASVGAPVPLALTRTPPCQPSLSLRSPRPLPHPARRTGGTRDAASCAPRRPLAASPPGKERGGRRRGHPGQEHHPPLSSLSRVPATVTRGYAGRTRSCSGRIRSCCSGTTPDCAGRTPTANSAHSVNSPARGTTTASWAAARGRRWPHARAWPTARRCVSTSPHLRAARDRTLSHTPHSPAPLLPRRRRCSPGTTCTTAARLTPKRPGSCRRHRRRRPCPRP